MIYAAIYTLPPGSFSWNRPSSPPQPWLPVPLKHYSHKKLLARRRNRGVSRANARLQRLSRERPLVCSIPSFAIFAPISGITLRKLSNYLIIFRTIFCKNRRITKRTHVVFLIYPCPSTDVLTSTKISLNNKSHPVLSTNFSPPCESPCPNTLFPLSNPAPEQQKAVRPIHEVVTNL